MPPAANTQPPKIQALVIGGVIAVLLILGFVWFGMGVSYRNQAVELEVAAKNQVDVNKTVHDTMKQVVFGQAGVATAYADKFEKVYTQMMTARYSSGGEMLKFIQEANPDLDASLYKTVQQSIEEQRALFQASQKKLISYREQHDRLRQTWPGSMFLAGRPPIEVPIVTSTATEKAFETGRDDADSNPFAR